MIVCSIPIKRAVSVLLAGMALFLFSCQPKKPTTATDRESRSDPFAMAEKYQRSGNFQKALADYHIFLKRAPGDNRIPLALQRIAEIHLKLKQPEKALGSLQRLSKTYPNYTWMPEIRYQISLILAHLGKYETSAREAFRWLDRYQQHFLKKDILVLLGDDFCALGETEEAFFWWVEAKRIWKDDPAKEMQLNEKLEILMSTAGPILLDRLLENEKTAIYPPDIYHQMSRVFLSQNELGRAEKAAQLLIRSTRDSRWISMGEAILAQIAEEMSISTNRIGCLLPLSGPFAVFGQEVLNGITLGMLNVPLDGKQIEVIIKDTGGSPEKAMDELEGLVKKQKVVGIIGPLSSKTAVSIAAEAQKLGIPMVALTQHQNIVKEGNMVFRNFLTPTQEINALLQVAMGQWGLARFGILYPDNAYGRFCMNLFWDKLDEMGGSVTAVESYPTDATDFADQIKKMVGLYHNGKTADGKEAPPLIDFDAIFIPDIYQRVAMIAPQLAFHDVLGIRLMGTRPWHSPQLLSLANNYLQGAVFSSGFAADSENPKVMAFVNDYRNNFGAIPGILAASGYDTIRLLKTILTQGNLQTRNDLRQALVDLPVFDGVTGPFTFDTEGEARKMPLLLTISGNRAVSIN